MTDYALIYRNFYDYHNKANPEKAALYAHQDTVDIIMRNEKMFRLSAMEFLNGMIPDARRIGLYK